MEKDIIQDNFLNKFTIGKGLKNEALGGKFVPTNEPVKGIFDLANDLTSYKAAKINERQRNREIENYIKDENFYVEEQGLVKRKIMSSVKDKKITITIDHTPRGSQPIASGGVGFFPLEMKSLTAALKTYSGLDIKNDQIKKVCISDSGVACQSVLWDGGDGNLAYPRYGSTNLLLGNRVKIKILDWSKSVADWNGMPGVPFKLGPNARSMNGLYLDVVAYSGGNKYNSAYKGSDWGDFNDKFFDYGDDNAQLITHFKKNGYVVTESVFDAGKIYTIDIDATGGKTELKILPHATTIIPPSNGTEYYMVNNRTASNYNVTLTCYIEISLQKLLFEKTGNITNLKTEIMIPEIIGPDTAWLKEISRDDALLDSLGDWKFMALDWKAIIIGDLTNTWKEWIKLYKLLKVIYNKLKEFTSFNIDKVVHVLSLIEKYNEDVTEFASTSNQTVLELVNSYYNKTYTNAFVFIKQGSRLQTLTEEIQNPISVYTKLAEIFNDNLSTLLPVIKEKVNVVYDINKVKGRITLVFNEFQKEELLQELDRIKPAIEAMANKKKRELEEAKKRLVDATFKGEAQDLDLNEQKNEWVRAQMGIDENEKDLNDLNTIYTMVVESYPTGKSIDNSLIKKGRDLILKTNPNAKFKSDDTMERVSGSRREIRKERDMNKMLNAKRERKNKRTAVMGL